MYSIWLLMSAWRISTVCYLERWKNNTHTDKHFLRFGLK